MFSVQRINARKNGISDALKLKESTSELSEKTVNKLLQILYNDLRMVANIVYDRQAERWPYSPIALITSGIITRYILQTGQRNQFGELDPQDFVRVHNKWIWPKYLDEKEIFNSLKILMELILSKYLFLQEITEANRVLRESPFSMTDTRRKEMIAYLSTVEQKAKSQSVLIATAIVNKLYRMRCVRAKNAEEFINVMEEYLTVDFINDKSTLFAFDNGANVKRRVKSFTSYNTLQLKEKIDTIVFSFAAKSEHKEFELWERLIELSREDEVKYKQGTRITLYYTGNDGTYDWYTAEECAENKFDTLRGITKKIPSEYEYIKAVNKYHKKYRERHGPAA